MTDADSTNGAADPDPGDISGPWVGCPRCGERVSLARFEASDDEPGMAAGVCPSCAERIDLLSG